MCRRKNYDHVFFYNFIQSRNDTLEKRFPSVLSEDTMASP